MRRLRRMILLGDLPSLKRVGNWMLFVNGFESFMFCLWLMVYYMWFLIEYVKLTDL